MFKTTILLILLCSVAGAHELLIASYNVHNLFDTEKDEGKDDWTYTSKDTPGKLEYCKGLSNPYYKKSCLETNWNERRLKRKFISIRKMLKKGFERMPDIVALQEVENDKVVGQLAEFIGYDLHYTTESADRRGIDVAFLVKKSEGMSVLNAIEHEVAGDFLVKPTRNVLELALDVHGKKLSVFSNHWPSQAAPSEVRVGVAKLVKEIVLERLKDPNHHVILAGDFNTINKDHPHPFKDVIEAGEGALINIYERFKSDRSIPWEVKDAMPLGTYFYKRNMEWNVLDNFFVSPNMLDGKGVEVELKSFKIVAPRFAKEDFIYDENRNSSLYGSVVVGVPKRYNHKVSYKILSAGYSDHFPIQIKVKF